MTEQEHKQEVGLVVSEEADAKQEPQIIGELHIRTYEDGRLELFVPDTSREYTPGEVEELTNMIHKQLYEQRIAQMALDMFKTRLG